MATLVFTRPTPLSLADAARLPSTAVVDNSGAGAVVRMSVDAADLGAVVDAAVTLGRLLPDATVTVEGLASPALPAVVPDAATDDVAAERVGSADAAPPPAAPPTDTDDPWELVRQRRFDEVLAVLAGTALDSLGRDVVRELLSSTDPEEVALACDIARITQWKSFVSTMRRKLDHADTRVRVAAVRAIGHLSGPAMIWHLQKLSGDASADVQAAVADAVAEIEGRQG